MLNWHGYRWQYFWIHLASTVWWLRWAAKMDNALRPLLISHKTLFVTKHTVLKPWEWCYTTPKFDRHLKQWTTVVMLRYLIKFNAVGKFWTYFLLVKDFLRRLSGGKMTYNPLVNRGPGVLLVVMKSGIAPVSRWGDFLVAARERRTLMEAFISIGLDVYLTTSILLNRGIGKY